MFHSHCEPRLVVPRPVESASPKMYTRGHTPDKQRYNLEPLSPSTNTKKTRALERDRSSPRRRCLHVPATEHDTATHGALTTRDVWATPRRHNMASQLQPVDNARLDWIPVRNLILPSNVPPNGNHNRPLRKSSGRRLRSQSHATSHVLCGCVGTTSSSSQRRLSGVAWVQPSEEDAMALWLQARATVRTENRYGAPRHGANTKNPSQLFSTVTMCRCAGSTCITNRLVLYKQATAYLSGLGNAHSLWAIMRPTGGRRP